MSSGRNTKAKWRREWRSKRIWERASARQMKRGMVRDGNIEENGGRKVMPKPIKINAQLSLTHYTRGRISWHVNVSVLNLG